LSVGKKIARFERIVARLIGHLLAASDRQQH
jgi:hypothetical protein